MATTSGGAGRLSSQNLRDFLRIKEEEHHHITMNRATTNSGVDRNTISGLTLSAILSDKVRPPPEEPRPRVQSNRTLLDIIQDDQDPLGEDGGQSWRNLTERLRLSCSSASGSGWNSTAPNVTVNNNDGGNRMISRPLSSFSSDSTERNISAVSRRSTERTIGRFEHNVKAHVFENSFSKNSLKHDFLSCRMMKPIKKKGCTVVYTMAKSFCVKASSSTLLELVPETNKENLDFELPMYDPSKGLVVDLAVLGGGPAGLAVAQQVAEAGLSVCSIDPSPKMIWPNNYGVWVDEFEAMDLLNCLDTTWSGAVVYINDKTRKDLDRPYGRVNRKQLKSKMMQKCILNGVKFHQAKVVKVIHEESK